MAYSDAGRRARALQSNSRRRKERGEEYAAKKRAWDVASYERHKEARKGKMRAAYARDRRSYKRRALLARYGLTEDAFHVRLDAQNHECAVCREPLSQDHRVHVDHSHESGHVRGLLCLNCNVGLGMFRDDPARLRLAALYLEEHNGTS